MQNEPNLRNAKMNVSYLSATNYGDKRYADCPENKPNTNPIKANLRPKRTQTNPILPPPPLIFMQFLVYASGSSQADKLAKTPIRYNCQTSQIA